VAGAFIGRRQCITSGASLADSSATTPRIIALLSRSSSLVYSLFIRPSSFFRFSHKVIRVLCSRVKRASTHLLTWQRGISRAREKLGFIYTISCAHHSSSSESATKNKPSSRFPTGKFAAAPPC
jgi:hypothetical protein